MALPWAGAADPVALARTVDGHFARAWAGAGVRPADSASDAAFARRVHLDLIGRVPTVAEVRAYLDDRGPDKRVRLVARLANSAAFARHWATVWRREWVPQADQPQSPLPDELDEWLAGRLRDGTGYDRIARDLLTAGAGSRGRTPTTFLTAAESRPENLAANAGRAFLGLNLDCAQCHDHPFARWTRDQFWETAAFFARPDPGAGSDPLAIPVGDSARRVGPRFLDGTAPAFPAPVGPTAGRVEFAQWMTGPSNPYFARNAVNRTWATLFGAGLVEPLDDLSGETPASYPEMLADLERAFAQSGFDVRFLVSALVLTRAYGLAADGEATDPRLVARFPVRGLTGEQLYDSLWVAAGLPVGAPDDAPATGDRGRRRFVERFRVERTGIARRTILQSLALMNGETARALTDPATTPTLRAVADAPFLDPAGRIEALFLAALGRPPTPGESKELTAYLTAGGPDRDPRKALADVLWALLNSSEFGTNH